MSDEEIIGYVSRFGGMCRDCADECGVCPHSGVPCDTDQRRAVIATTIKALRYGIEHQFIPNIFTERSAENALSPSTEVPDAPFAWWWEDKQGQTYITLDRPDVHQMAREVFAEPRALYSESPSPQPNPQVDTSILRERISRAIFDPGQTEGYKGKRTLTDWQTDAVMRVIESALAAEGNR